MSPITSSRTRLTTTAPLSPAGSAVEAARTRLVAGLVAATGVLLLIGESLLPKGADQHVTSRPMALAELAAAQGHRGQLLAAGLLIVFGLGGLAVTFAALSGLVRERAAGLATLAAALGTLAAFCGAVINVLSSLIVVAATTTGLPERDAAGFLVAAQHDSHIALAFGPTYLVGLPLASLLMSVALWRSKAVPRWTAVLFAVGMLAALSAPTGPVGGAVCLPLALALCSLAGRLLTRPSRHPATT